MLREMQGVRHLELSDPLSAEIVESRLIARMLPRYNRAGTRADKYCFVRLDDDAAWPRLTIVKDPGRTGVHLGPLPSRAMAQLVVEGLQSALPLRRCATRLTASHVPAPGAVACTPAQMGVTHCPCAGLADPAGYAAAVDGARRAMTGNPSTVVAHLTGRMAELAAAQRYEEAAMVRDRLSALLGAVRRDRLVAALLAAGRCTVRRGDATWVVDAARLVDVTIAGTAGRALPVDPPPAPEPGRPLSRAQIDEALCLARSFDQRADSLEVLTCSGTWQFPVSASDALPRLHHDSPDHATASQPVTPSSSDVGALTTAPS